MAANHVLVRQTNRLCSAVCTLPLPRHGLRRVSSSGSRRPLPWPAPLSTSHALPSFVKIVEVGPRDGLQNEATPVPTATKIELIERLGAAGIGYIEASSFVSARWVPQMGDAAAVFAGLNRRPGTTYAALAPNVKGIEAAIESRVEEVAIFAAATDSFSRRNINCNVEDSFLRFRPVVAAAREAGVRVRGYVSCVLGCPYEGSVDPEAVAYVAQTLLEMGCYEVSLGDTIGVGTPIGVRRLLTAVQAHVPAHALAVHFHATYGCAMANIMAAIEMGVATVDSSVAGLGGCPYARGASGNVATEDVVYMLEGCGVRTGVDLDALCSVGHWISGILGRPNASKVGVARVAQRRALAEAEAAVAAAGDDADVAAAAKAELGVRCIGVSWPAVPPQPR